MEEEAFKERCDVCLAFQSNLWRTMRLDGSLNCQRKLQSSSLASGFFYSSSTAGLINRGLAG